MTSRLRAHLGWIVALTLIVSLGGALAAPAVGGPTFLTIGKAKKVFVTKKKAKKTYATKAALSGRLTPAKADARYLSKTGETRIAVPPAAWTLADNTSNVIVSHQPSYTTLAKTSSSAQDVDYFAPVPLPTVIAGNTVGVVGAEICYSIAETALVEPIIDRIIVQRAFGGPTSPVPISLSTIGVDDTGRVDSACTTIRFNRVALATISVVGLGLRVDYPDANTAILLGAASLVLVN